MPQKPYVKDFAPEDKTTLQEILGQRATAPIPERPNGLPDTPPPAGFLPDPDQRALDPLTAQMLFRFLQAVPELRNKVDKITLGPSNMSMRYIAEANELNSKYDRNSKPVHTGVFPANIGGFTDKIGGREITINHQQPQWVNNLVMGHELGHVAGFRHGDPELDTLERIASPGGKNYYDRLEKK